MNHELLSRDHETGNPLAGLSGLSRRSFNVGGSAASAKKMGVPARHREPARSGEAGGPPGNSSSGTAGLVSVPERYVAGSDTRGRQEGRQYPWSQQVIHEISGLENILA
jgi:hypothetical protein